MPSRYSQMFSRCPHDVLTQRRFSDILYILSEKKTAKKTNDPKGTSIGRMDFDNQEVYSDTSIFDGLVLQGARPA